MNSTRSDFVSEMRFGDMMRTFYPRWYVSEEKIPRSIFASEMTFDITFLVTFLPISKNHGRYRISNASLTSISF